MRSCLGGSNGCDVCGGDACDGDVCGRGKCSDVCHCIYLMFVVVIVVSIVVVIVVMIDDAADLGSVCDDSNCGVGICSVGDCDDL